MRIRFIVKYILGISTVLLVNGCASIQPQPLIPFHDGEYSMLYRPLTYQDEESGRRIVVPEGFVTDFASVPRPLRGVISKTGRYQFPAVVHDYLYWEQFTTKEEADTLFLNAMKDSGVSWWKRRKFYRAVDLFGKSAWNKNMREKEEGLPRVIPEGWREIPPNTSWEDYRKMIPAGTQESGPYAKTRAEQTN